MTGVESDNNILCVVCEGVTNNKIRLETLFQMSCFIPMAQYGIDVDVDIEIVIVMSGDERFARLLTF